MRRIADLNSVGSALNWISFSFIRHNGECGHSSPRRKIFANLNCSSEYRLTIHEKRYLFADGRFKRPMKRHYVMIPNLLTAPQ
jgi:hypothetical protein